VRQRLRRTRRGVEWFRVGQSPVSFGTGGDNPLPLLSAIRRAYFP